MQFLELNWFESGLRYIMAWLCSFIYPLISLVYNLFRYVSQVNILSSDTVQPIYQRVTMILTIVMVFYITFEFVKYVVEPAGITDKEKGAGKLVYKMIAVVVLIAFVPTIFTYAFKFQNVIVDKDVIGKVILGNNTKVSYNYGGEFSESIFKLFYKNSDEGKEAMCGDMPCEAIVNANYNALVVSNNLPYITTGLNEAYEIEEKTLSGTIKVNTPYIEFDGLFAVVVGGLIAYMLILYCVDVGTRWAQLVFLQVIAPIPIIGFLSPKKDGIFQKWYKQCLTTYLDLFIRIAIINFVLLISRILLDGLESNEILKGLEGVSGFARTLVIIVLILGLLLFAQKAPKMLGELFPKMGAASGNFGLKGGERVAPLAARAIGAGAGGLNRLVKGAIASGYNARKRNQANGKLSSWTKGGRAQRAEERTQRKTNMASYREAQKNLRNARKKYRSSGTNFEEVQKAQDELNESRNKIAKAKNEQYRSVGGSAAIGGLYGAWQGATTGAQATKFGEIKKKVQEGNKKNADAIQAKENYLNAGGAGGITGWADRQIVKTQQNIGMQTRAENVEAQIKSYDSQISTIKQRAAVAASVSKNLDSSTDINRSKIADGKSKHKIESLDKFDASNKEIRTIAKAAGYIKTNDDGTLDETKLTEMAGKDFDVIYRETLAKEKDAQARAEALSKEAQADPSNITKANEARQAQQDAAIAEQNTKKVQKALAEYGNTQILKAEDKDRKNPEKFDQGAVNSIINSMQRLEDGVSNPIIKDKLTDYLKDFTFAGKSPNSSEPNYDPDYEACLKGIENPKQIKSNTVLDLLGKALQSVSSEFENDASRIENAKNRLSSGKYRAEVTANANAGKK